MLVSFIKMFILRHFIAVSGGVLLHPSLPVKSVYAPCLFSQLCGGNIIATWIIVRLFRQ